MTTLIDLAHSSSKLDIVIYPDPALHKKAKPIEKFDEQLKELAGKMLKTMYEAPGIGLAGPQVAFDKRIFVLDVDYEREEKELPDGSHEVLLSKKNPRIFINPVFKPKSQKKTKYKEGCLSLPGIYDDVTRFSEIIVTYLDIEGNTHEEEAQDLLSICIQHETDHLDGVMFIERLSPLKKNFYKKKFQKLKKKS